MVVNEESDYNKFTSVAHATGSVGVGGVLAAIFAMGAVAVCAAKCYKRMIVRANENPPTTVIQQIQRSTSPDSSASVSQRSSVHSRSGRGGGGAEGDGTGGGGGSEWRRTSPGDSFAAPPFSPALPMTSTAPGGGNGAVMTAKNGNTASIGWRQYGDEWRAHFKCNTQHLPCSYPTEQRCASGRSTPTPLHRGNYWPSASHRQSSHSAFGTPSHRRSLPATLAYEGGGGRDMKKEISEFIHSKMDQILAGNTFNDHDPNPGNGDKHQQQQQQKKPQHSGKINNANSCSPKETEGNLVPSTSMEYIKNKKDNLKIEFLEQEEMDTAVENDYSLRLKKSWSPCSELVPSTTASPVEEGEKSEAESQNPKLGYLYYSIKYHQFKQMLQVHINRAEGLPPCDRVPNRWDDEERPKTGIRTEADPFIKLQILPEKRLKVKTRVLKRTRDPVYDETFSFYGISPEKIRRLSLHFAILSFDRFSHDNVIGEVFHSLAEVDLSGKDPAAIVQEISPRSLKKINKNKGEILISLCHEPTANKFIVGVLKAKDLPTVDFSKSADPYVKVQVTHSGQKTKKKTEVKKQTTNPVFNESLSFDVPSEGLMDVQLEVIICNWDRVTKHAPLGTLCFSLQNEMKGNKGSNEESKEALPYSHFWEANQNPRKAVAKWHALS